VFFELAPALAATARGFPARFCALDELTAATFGMAGRGGAGFPAR